VTRGTFEVKPGSLFPALHRLEENGSLASEWGGSENNRRANTTSSPSGERQLQTEEKNWERISRAIARALQSTSYGGEHEPLPRLLSLLSNLFRKERVERELDAEVIAYLDQLTDEKVRGHEPRASSPERDRAWRRRAGQGGGPRRRAGAMIEQFWRTCASPCVPPAQPGSRHRRATLALGIGANAASSAWFARAAAPPGQPRRRAPRLHPPERAASAWRTPRSPSRNQRPQSARHTISASAISRRSTSP